MNSKNDTAIIIVALLIVGLIVMLYVDSRFEKFEAKVQNQPMRLKPPMNVIRPVTTVNIANLQATNVMIGDHNKLNNNTLQTKVA